MWASFNGHEDVVKLLLEYSKVFDINIPKKFQLRIEVDKIFKSWRRKDLRKDHLLWRDAPTV